jgi:hypothetical protein
MGDQETKPNPEPIGSRPFPVPSETTYDAEGWARSYARQGTQGRIMRSSKFDPRRRFPSATLNKKIVTGLLLVAVVIFLAAVIGGIFK